ncbi:hypothetical protein LTR10_023282 [Elasticomyces elasticus]|uniref:Uncharacterized protein n=1 Tax=Exophiala sideris TaxID=1016849 RepID=A0ABR0IZB5_9EURO|nr:hypothetical protein LTR10_023282 [Elasticomyces elasticus]KAK5023086.1 hypothetical protein LTS07_009579 [Exophiala sideris]KAK5026811.1 hypothetical protein LTR13_009851 [Exophiala sideris]KAK5052464.1 hypothetical protein LTR69_009802 [Exophiala sideris]KAK5178249.1 hypothetical protein LTR44_009333 [Eurotiomycetes sp. CCFEE 6388]
MYKPNSPWTWAFSLIALAQAAIVLAFESYAFAHFQTNLEGNDSDHENASRTIPTFETLYIFGFLYQLVLVWDALRMKNTIQVIGLVMYNVGLLIYGAVQMSQIKEAIETLTGFINQEVWNDTKPFLIAIPCILALGTVLMAVCAWKLYDEFAWTIYKRISADLRMKQRYLQYQVYIALLKFDFFFFLGFTVQFVVIVTTRRAEFALTIAAIPVTILILLAAAWFVRRENLTGTIGIIILYFGGLAYFIFKMVRMYSHSHESPYLPARKELTSFAVLTIILIIATIINACICASNYRKGLKPYIYKSTSIDDDEKPIGSSYAPYATEMGQGNKYPTAGPSANRMEID